MIQVSQMMQFTFFSENKDVNKQNEEFLDKIDKPEVLSKAVVKHSTMKNYKPSLERDGSIKGTPLQSILKLKIGAEVMLTYNSNSHG